MTSILARSVEVTDEDIVVNLMTGDPIQIPIRWFPSLQRADRVAREGCVLRDEGLLIVWPDVPQYGSHDAPAEELCRGYIGGPRADPARTHAVYSLDAIRLDGYAQIDVPAGERCLDELTLIVTGID